MTRNCLKVTVLVFTLSLIGILTACNNQSESGNDNTNDENVKLDFWDNNSTPESQAIWEDIIENFEDENPNIEVEYVGLPADSAESKFQTAVETGDAPDVATVNSSWMPNYAARDALLPLDEYNEESDLNGKINENELEYNREIVIDGKLYGIPYSQNSDVFWIRTDLLEEAGIDEPTDWDDFFSVVKEVSNDDQKGMSIRGGDKGAYPLQTLIFAHSGDKEFFDDNGKANIKKEETIEFIENYLGLYGEYTPESDITAGVDELLQNFDSGSAFSIFHNLGSAPQHEDSFDDDQYKAIPAPKSQNGNYMIQGGNDLDIVVFKDTENPDAAWKLTEFINSKESQSHWNKERGQVPTNSDVMDENWIEEEEHIKTFLEITTDSNTEIFRTPQNLPDYDDIMQNVVNPGMQKVMSGEMTAEEFVNEWGDEMEQANKKYQEAIGN